MSEQYQPSKEMTEFEHRLAASNPPAANIDRDELMYRSGWAAAEAQFKNGQAGVPSWTWPASSAALATLCAVLAIMVFQKPTSESNNLASNPQPNTTAVVKSPAPLVQSDTIENSNDTPEDSLAETNPNTPQFGSAPSVFGFKVPAFSNPLSQRQIRQFNEPYQTPSDDESFGGTPHSPSTVGTLLRELISDEEAL